MPDLTLPQLLAAALLVAATIGLLIRCVKTSRFLLGIALLSALVAFLLALFGLL